MSIKVIEPGLLTTIQDLGRPGYFHLGIPIGGAMDRVALRSANLLVGNEEGAAALEAVFMGPKLLIMKDVIVAVTGATIPILVDGKEQPGWTSFEVKSGQTLSFGYLQAGARAYIAFAGGITTPKSLGSRSTYAIGGLGGINGRPIAADDSIPIGSANDAKTNLCIPERFQRINGLKETTELRVLPGLYWHRITDTAQSNFFEDVWTVAPEADRMGYRFKNGRKLDFVDRDQPFGAGSDPSNIVDGCYPYGSIQVPGGTEPIVLHRDAVSGGGYFMIGTVISADMDLIGQLQPNTKVKFSKVNMDEAMQARIERSNLLKQIRDHLA